MKQNVKDFIEETLSNLFEDRAKHKIHTERLSPETIQISVKGGSYKVKINGTKSQWRKPTVLGNKTEWGFVEITYEWKMLKHDILEQKELRARHIMQQEEKKNKLEEPTLLLLDKILNRPKRFHFKKNQTVLEMFTTYNPEYPDFPAVDCKEVDQVILLEDKDTKQIFKLTSQQQVSYPEFFNESESLLLGRAFNKIYNERKDEINRKKKEREERRKQKRDNEQRDKMKALYGIKKGEDNE